MYYEDYENAASLRVFQLKNRARSQLVQIAAQK